MIAILAGISVALALVIVLVVAYHLIGVFVALKRGADHLAALVEGLDKIRTDTRPLNDRVDEINTALAALVDPLLGANGNLGAIADVTRGLARDRYPPRTHRDVL